MIPPVVGRLAPTPSGELHLGNALSFLACWLSARSSQGRVLLRFEDVDRSRARRHVEDHQRRDLEWLGLTWDEERPPQRARDYAPWLDRLDTYTCACTRRTIQEGGGSHPIECRTWAASTGSTRFVLPDRSIRFVDRVHGQRTVHPLAFGDPMLRRRDGVFTYSLAVVMDDIADGVTEVVRGADLLDYTGVQITLWRAMGATPPTWLHAPLLLTRDGAKLSKSNGATGIQALRSAGQTAEQVRAQLLRWLGQHEAAWEQPDLFDPTRIPRDAIRL